MTSTDNRTTERVDHPPRVRKAIDELMHEKDATDNQTTELLPCPFCGGEASKRLFYKGKYRVHCNVCDAHSGDVCDTEAEAIAAWNTRTAITELLPCPFCDGDANLMLNGNEGKLFWWVECRQCHASTDSRYDRADTIAAWNARAERTCNMDEHVADIAWCSACKHPMDYPSHSNYCPNCGARVVEVG